MALAHKVVLCQGLLPFATRGCSKRLAVRVSDLLSLLDDSRGKGQRLAAVVDPPVVGIAGMVDEGQGGVGGTADPPHVAIVVTDCDLVRVVVGHPHQVVDQPGKEQLLLAQSAVGLLGQVARVLEAPQEEDSGESLHHQLGALLLTSVVGDEIVERAEVLRRVRGLGWDSPTFLEIVSELFS